MKKLGLLALLTAFAALSAPGCVVSITDGEEACSEPPPPVECGGTWVCVDDEWKWRDIDDGRCGAECPAFEPAYGSACPALGLTCEYEFYDCAEEGKVTAECTPEGWRTYRGYCIAEPRCPEEMPIAGADCSEWYEAYFCGYDTACGYVDIHCDHTSEAPTWVLDSGTQHCPAGCAEAADPAACGTIPGCQWLEPGCADEPQEAIAAGCYPVVDCLASPEVCGEDQACSPFVYDPCAGQKCGACGAEYGICTPDEPGA